LNYDKSIIGGEAGDYITNHGCNRKTPMVELLTINKALPGDSLDYYKKTSLV
jgi:hypothetical protein